MQLRSIVDGQRRKNEPEQAIWRIHKLFMIIAAFLTVFPVINRYTRRCGYSSHPPHDPPALLPHLTTPTIRPIGEAFIGAEAGRAHLHDACNTRRTSCAHTRLHGRTCPHPAYETSQSFAPASCTLHRLKRTTGNVHGTPAFITETTPSNPAAQPASHLLPRHLHEHRTPTCTAETFFPHPEAHRAPQPFMPAPCLVPRFRVFQQHTDRRFPTETDGGHPCVPDYAG
jgi:hypothetical protein